MFDITQLLEKTFHIYELGKVIDSLESNGYYRKEGKYTDGVLCFSIVKVYRTSMYNVEIDIINCGTIIKNTKITAKTNIETLKIAPMFLFLFADSFSGNFSSINLAKGSNMIANKNPHKKGETIFKNPLINLMIAGTCVNKT